MKKSILMLTIVMLFGIYSSALSDSWTPASKTGTFSTTIYCTPELSPNVTSQNLGTFFTTSTSTTVAVVETVSWNLTGPEEATYTVNFGPTVINDGDAVLTGAWYFDTVLQSGDIVGVLGTNLPGPTGIGCENNVSDIQVIAFQTINIDPGTLEGPKSFVVTLTVSATI